MVYQKNKLKPRLPRGFIDTSAIEIRMMNTILSKICQVYEIYGFDPISTPIFEYTECLGNFLPM